MSSSWLPGLPTSDGGLGGVPATGSGAGGVELDSGLFDANGNVHMLNGVDMGLPMDMDLDLSQDAQNYNPMPPQPLNGASSLAPDQSMAAAAAAATNSNGTHPAQLQQEANLTGAGAGPLPTGFGMATSTSSSTLTEFTKRRNWSQRIIEELKDFLHILTPDGRIQYVSPSCKSITGYEPQVLIGKFIGEYVHPDDSGIFMREFNESIASGNSLRFFYRFKKDDGTYMIFECDGHPHISPDSSQGGAISASPNPGTPQLNGTCRGFFMMARPYPTKSAALLDSFLEHKIENERLKKRIEELKREEAEENAEQDKLFRDQPMSQPSVTPSESQHANSRAHHETKSDSTTDYQGMPPPAKPSVSNTALTRQNLDSALSAQKPDSIADKMSRYEASSTHLESIELLTGLRYRDGERSHGISTGDTSPALIRGDAGIAILLDRDRDGPKKDKKKLKVADEYVCADCGTLDSPEWRKGPKGPKTLCNACGLRWAKKEKKRSGDDGKNNSPLSAMQGSGSSMAPGASTVGMEGFPAPPGMPMQPSNGGST